MVHKAAFFIDNDIMYFTLETLLNKNEVLTFTPSLKILTRIINGEPIPLILAQEQFSELEINAVIPILKNFPDYAPLEEIQASFSFGFENVTPENVEKARNLLHSAIDANAWNATARPIRNILSRTRPKLKRLGFDCISMLQTGYMLKRVGTSFGTQILERIS